MIRRYIVAQINEVRFLRRGGIGVWYWPLWDAFLTLLGLFLLALVISVFSGFGLVVEICNN